jgi:hypothetical protein
MTYSEVHGVPFDPVFASGAAKSEHPSAVRKVLRILSVYLAAAALAAAVVVIVAMWKAYPDESLIGLSLAIPVITVLAAMSVGFRSTLRSEGTQCEVERHDVHMRTIIVVHREVPSQFELNLPHPKPERHVAR